MFETHTPLTSVQTQSLFHTVNHYKRFSFRRVQLTSMKVESKLDELQLDGLIHCYGSELTAVTEKAPKTAGLVKTDCDKSQPDRLYKVVPKAICDREEVIRLKLNYGEYLNLNIKAYREPTAYAEQERVDETIFVVEEEQAHRGEEKKHLLAPIIEDEDWLTPKVKQIEHGFALRNKAFGWSLQFTAKTYVDRRL